MFIFVTHPWFILVVIFRCFTCSLVSFVRFFSFMSHSVHFHIIYRHIYIHVNFTAKTSFLAVALSAVTRFISSWWQFLVNLSFFRGHTMQVIVFLVFC